MSYHIEQHKTVPLKQQLMTFKIDGITSELNYVDTVYDERLVAAAEYVTALTGCNPKYAASKISLLYKHFPDLRPAPHKLQDYGKVIRVLMHTVPIC